MEEDWGLDANQPPFSLFREASPEEEAQRDGMVDPTVYQRWTKSQRRLYQQLKTEYIIRKINLKKEMDMEDITESMNRLNFFKTEMAKQEPGEKKMYNEDKIDQLIGDLKQLMLDKKERSKIEKIEPSPVDIKPDISKLNSQVM